MTFFQPLFVWAEAKREIERVQAERKRGANSNSMFEHSFAQMGGIDPSPRPPQILFGSGGEDSARGSGASASAAVEDFFADVFGFSMPGVRRQESDLEYVERKVAELRREVSRATVELREAVQGALAGAVEGGRELAEQLGFRGEAEGSCGGPSGRGPRPPFSVPFWTGSADPDAHRNRLPAPLFDGFGDNFSFPLFASAANERASDPECRRKHEESLNRALVGIFAANAAFFAAWQVPRLERFCLHNLLCSRQHLRAANFPKCLYTPVLACLSHQKPLHFLFNCGALFVLSGLLGSNDMRVFEKVADCVNEKVFANKRRAALDGVSPVVSSPSPLLGAVTYPTTAGVEYTKFVLTTGAASILVHCLSGAQRPVLGISGALMGLLSLAACVEPERRVRMVFPVPGLSLSLSQIADVNLLVNGGMALFYALLASRGRLRRGIDFHAWNYRVEQRGGGFGSTSARSTPASEPQTAWLSHATGIGLGYAYYWYIHDEKHGLNLWPSNMEWSKTHSWNYIKYDWERTCSEIAVLK
eukprot:g1293.t1